MAKYANARRRLVVEGGFDVVVLFEAVMRTAVTGDDILQKGSAAKGEGTALSGEGNSTRVKNVIYDWL